MTSTATVAAALNQRVRIRFFTRSILNTYQSQYCYSLFEKAEILLKSSTIARICRPNRAFRGRISVDLNKKATVLSKPTCHFAEAGGDRYLLTRQQKRFLL